MDTIHQMVGGHESIVVASMCAWFTPTILFCVSNLIIATLFIASKSNTNTTKQHDHDQEYETSVQGYSFTPQIPKVSSFLERAKSINLSSCIPVNTINIPTHENISISKTAKYTSQSRLAQSIYFPCSYDTQPDSKRYPSKKKPNTQITLTNLAGQLAPVPSIDRVKRLKSKAPKEKISVVEIKKTRSEVRHVLDNEDDVNMRRPETARARRNADDDAKAENFIAKFREQLKLQRMDSLNRYNHMLRPQS